MTKAEDNNVKKSERKTALPGPTVKTIEGFAGNLERGIPFYFNGKFLSPGFVKNWTFAFVMKQIDAKRLRYAKWTRL